MKPSRRVGLWFACGWLALVVVAAIFADVIPFIADPYLIHPFNATEPPSWGHVLGTDALGRDLLSRIVHGARTSILVSLTTVGLALGLGGAIGIAAGYRRGRIDSVIMVMVDIMMAVPGFVLILTIVAFLGQSTVNVVVGLAVVVVPRLVRTVRAATLSVAQRDYVVAARTIGASHSRIMVREVLPNVALPMLSLALLLMGLVVLAEGGLSFLGLGVPPPQPTWGGIVAEGRSYLSTSPFISLEPATVWFLTVLALNVLGDRLRARFDGRTAAA